MIEAGRDTAQWWLHALKSTAAVQTKLIKYKYI